MPAGLVAALSLAMVIRYGLRMVQSAGSQEAGPNKAN